MSNNKLETKKDGLYINGEKIIKGWESFSGWYWFATELNDDGQHFGFVQGTYPEWGYFDEAEIMSLSPMAWQIKDCDLAHSGRRGDE